MKLTLELLRSHILRIPRGRVATYGQVAEAAGFPGCARQVVWALRAPAGARLPWHRVVAAGGRIALPGAAGLEQRIRLESEKVRFAGARVDMSCHAFDFGSPVQESRVASDGRRAARGG